MPTHLFLYFFVAISQGGISMAQESSDNKTPSEALQIEASKVMEQAKHRIADAEEKLRGSKNTAERIQAQKWVSEASAELEAAQEKYGWVFDWQKASAAAKTQMDAMAAGARDAMGHTEQTIKAEAAAVKKHIVQKGESLSLIAKHYTGDVKKWKELYEANLATVGKNPDLIQPGMVLIIPWQGV
jgi:nucleoid-associated protein YgaU